MKAVGMNHNKKQETVTKQDKTSIMKGTQCSCTTVTMHCKASQPKEIEQV